MEDFDLNINDLDTVNINIDNDNGYSNSIPGIEYLMNDKKKSSNSVNVKIEEINELENELNNVSSKSGGGQPSNAFNFGSSFFSSNSNSQNEKIPENENTDSYLGKATKSVFEKTQSTWDGFQKMSEIPFTSDKGFAMDDREKKRKKRMMIKKLDDLHEKGVLKNNSHFTMDSSYEDIEDEYEAAMEDKRKRDSIKLQGWWFQTVINSMEYANTALNPFDLNLDGWGEQVSEDLESYDEIFSELHEKYKGGKMAPELSLLLRIGFSAAIVNFTNKALSTATPGFNDVIKQSPELMKMFSNATAASMKNSSPAFDFASNLMNKPNEMKNSFGPPPVPIKTRNDAPPISRQQEPAQSQSRPDINIARGGSTMFREKGVETNNFSSLSEDRPPSAIPMTFTSGGQLQGNIQPQNQYFSGPPPAPIETKDIYRKEMQGPKNTDIDNILSGLKTKVIDIHEEEVQNELRDGGDDSMISISSLKDLNSSNVPKRTRRKKNSSNKNTVSLDI